MRRIGSAATVVTGVISLVFMLTLSFSVSSAWAEYPDRAVSLTVPFPPGGMADLGARALADAMQKHMNQPVVVVNKAGGASTIGGNAVASAKPDGYTLGYFPSLAAIPEAYAYFFNAPYSSAAFKPVCRIGTAIGSICVKGDSPIKEFKDLVEFLRKNPGTKWGINSKSSASYIIVRDIAKAEKLNIIDVVLDGDAKIIPALLGSHVPVGSPTLPPVRSLVAANEIRLLALIAERHEEFMPKVPTVVDLGYRYPAGMFLGLFAPKGTPEAVVKTLNETVAKVCQEPAFRGRMAEFGIISSFANTKSFDASVHQDITDLQNFFKAEGMVK